MDTATVSHIDTGCGVVPTEPVVGHMWAKVPQSAPSGPRLQYLLGDELAPLVEEALEGFEPRGHQVGLPVLMLDGGEPWELGNAWMRETFSGSGSTTRENYAGDVLAFADWCRAEGIDVGATTPRDLMEYRRVRVHDDGAMPRTWNRNLMGIVSFLRWLEERDGLKRTPARLKELRVPEGTSPVHAVDRADFQLFRNVGLRGLGLDGRPDPGFTGETGERDSLYADLIIVTGLRRSEAAHLLLTDLPLARRGKDRLHFVELPAVICKGGKARQVQLPDAFLARYWRYLESEWCSLVDAAQKSYRRSEPIIISDLEGGVGRIGSRVIRLETTPPRERRRLVLQAHVARSLGLPAEDNWLVPLGVFPGHAVPLPTPQHWTSTFAAADSRVNALLTKAGRDPLPPIRPHVVRHTFGVEYLRSAMQLMQGRGVDALMSQDERRIRRHFENPINELRLLMGHATVETTLGYLTVLRRSDPLAMLPFSSWAEELLGGEGAGEDVDA